jgi:ubiquinone/menaquinone biosynthesis C-methylase UbiE
MQINPVQLKCGIPRISDIETVLNSENYMQMHRYSEAYCRENAQSLVHYKWIKDALNQWSRIYEYSYCFEKIQDTLAPGASILDAGSGVTFFPFFLSSQYNVTCIDQDDYFEIYKDINARQNSKAEFVQSGLKQLPVPSNSYDAVICISVLEHTTGFETILNEFNRVLRPNGQLVVTFDVALDGNHEGIDPIIAKDFIARITDMFEMNYTATDFYSDLSDPAIYTTRYVRQWDERLLPWPRYTLLRAAKDFLKGNRGRTWAGANINMTFCNITARKKPAL